VVIIIKQVLTLLSRYLCPETSHIFVLQIMKKLIEISHPLLTKRHVGLLKHFGILTLTQLLSLPPERLSSILVIPFTAVTQLRTELFRSYGSQPVSGLEIYQSRLTREQNPLSTGSRLLDQLLDGGIQLGKVHEVFGLAGAGRTQLCLTVSALCSLKGGNVAYIDTRGEFTPHRFQEIVINRQEDNITDADKLQALDLVKVASPRNHKELVKVVQHLLSGDSSLKLVIIDNMTSPLMPLTSISTGNSSLLPEAYSTSTQLVQMLHQMATRGAAVLVVSNVKVQTNSDQGDEPRRDFIPSLRGLWRGMSHMSMYMEQVGLTDRNVKLVGGRKGECLVSIGPAGVS